MTGCLVPLTDLAKRITPGSRFALVLRYVATWCALGLVVVDAFACGFISLVNRVKRVFFCHLEALPSIVWLWLDLASQPGHPCGNKKRTGFHRPPTETILMAAASAALLGRLTRGESEHGHESLKAVAERRMPEELLDCYETQDSRCDPRSEFSLVVPLVHARHNSTRLERVSGFWASAAFYGQVPLNGQSPRARVGFGKPERSVCDKCSLRLGKST
jgi:hypothetical protein